MDQDWRNKIKARFPEWQTEAALARWPEEKSRLAIGQQVTGVVISVAPFGVWLDIGIPHPALMLVTEMARPSDRPMQASDRPAIGARVNATIVTLGARAEIGVSQFPAGSYWATRHPELIPHPRIF